MEPRPVQRSSAADKRRQLRSQRPPKQCVRNHWRSSTVPSPNHPHPRALSLAAGSMEDGMPLKRTIEKARRDKREGKSASTQAGEFVREEIDKIRRGEHGARSTKQAIAIGL